jgi:hypothetical protein
MTDMDDKIVDLKRRSDRLRQQDLEQERVMTEQRKPWDEVVSQIKEVEHSLPNHISYTFFEVKYPDPFHEDDRRYIKISWYLLKKRNNQIVVIVETKRTKEADKLKTTHQENVEFKNIDDLDFTGSDEIISKIKEQLPKFIDLINEKAETFQQS